MVMRHGSLGGFCSFPVRQGKVQAGQMPHNSSWFLDKGMFGICDVSWRAWRIKVAVAVPCATQ